MMNNIRGDGEGTKIRNTAMALICLTCVYCDKPVGIKYIIDVIG